MLEEFKTLSHAISRRLNQHHQLYPIIKVKDYLWEYILTESLNEVLPDYCAQWDYGSQQIGRDITLRNQIGISCKSGQIHADGRIKISSSRLSRFSDVEKVKEYLCTSKTEDYILCLSTHKGTRSNAFDGEARYLFSIYEPEVFDYQNMQWELFGKDQNLRGINPAGVTVTCTKAMGWQVWYYLPLGLALYSKLVPTEDEVDCVVVKNAAQDHIFSFD